MSDPVKNSLRGWGYRAVRRVTDWKEWFKDRGGLPEGHPETEDSIAIHTVWYDGQGKIHAVSEDATYPQGEDLEELKRDMERYVSAMEDPILNYDELPEKDALPIGVVDPKMDLKKVALTAAEIIAKAQGNEIPRMQG
jgi:hypothetical protein